MSTKVLTAKNAQKYENDVAIELPIPRYSSGKSSPIKSQEIGEIPKQKTKIRIIEIWSCSRARDIYPMRMQL